MQLEFAFYTKKIKIELQTGVGSAAKTKYGCTPYYILFLQ